jgi:hypothetical protein
MATPRSARAHVRVKLGESIVSGNFFFDFKFLAATGLVDLGLLRGLSLQSSFAGMEADAIESDDALRSVRAGTGEKLAARVERLNNMSNFIVRRMLL